MTRSLRALRRRARLLHCRALGHHWVDTTSYRLAAEGWNRRECRWCWDVELDRARPSGREFGVIA